MDESEKGESDKGDGTDPDKGKSDKEDKIDSKLPKYKVGTFVIKEVDNIWCTGVIHRVIFEKKSFVYSVKLNEVDFEEGIMEDEIDQFVFSSDGWIVMRTLMFLS